MASYLRRYNSSYIWQGKFVKNEWGKECYVEKCKERREWEYG
jgi:hypothetical protein